MIDACCSRLKALLVTSAGKKLMRSSPMSFALSMILQELKTVLQFITSNYAGDFRSRFIAESPAKLQMIYQYYAAFYGLNGFPYKKCNAPWVSTVIEADGTVRPCFFHQSLGNIHTTPLEQIINSESAVAFRKNLDMDNNDTCIKCVCYLNLAPNKSLS